MLTVLLIIQTGTSSHCATSSQVPLNATFSVSDMKLLTSLNWSLSPVNTSYDTKPPADGSLSIQYGPMNGGREEGFSSNCCMVNPGCVTVSLKMMIPFDNTCRKKRINTDTDVPLHENALAL